MPPTFPPAYCSTLSVDFKSWGNARAYARASRKLRKTSHSGRACWRAARLAHPIEQIAEECGSTIAELLREWIEPGREKRAGRETVAVAHGVPYGYC